jgi:hypothetical protein
MEVGVMSEMRDCRPLSYGPLPIMIDEAGSERAGWRESATNRRREHDLCAHAVAYVYTRALYPVRPCSACRYIASMS